MAKDSNRDVHSHESKYGDDMANGDDTMILSSSKYKGAGSFHIHRKTMKELGTLAVLGVREQPNLAQNIVTNIH